MPQPADRGRPTWGGPQGASQRGGAGGTGPSAVRRPDPSLHRWEGWGLACLIISQTGPGGRDVCFVLSFCSGCRCLWRGQQKGAAWGSRGAALPHPHPHAAQRQAWGGWAGLQGRAPGPSGTWKQFSVTWGGAPSLSPGSSPTASRSRPDAALVFVYLKMLERRDSF